VLPRISPIELNRIRLPVLSRRSLTGNCAFYKHFVTNIEVRVANLFLIIFVVTSDFLSDFLKKKKKLPNMRKFRDPNPDFYGFRALESQIRWFRRHICEKSAENRPVGARK